MNRRTRMLQFSSETKRKIHERDQGCFFCQQGYHMEASITFMYVPKDIMHLVNKSQGGLGVERNGIEGCRYHHSLLDNGSEGLRDEMISMLEEYMQQLYPGWSRESVTYKKYG